MDTKHPSSTASQAVNESFPIKKLPPQTLTNSPHTVTNTEQSYTESLEDPATMTDTIPSNEGTNAKPGMTNPNLTPRCDGPSLKM